MKRLITREDVEGLSGSASPSIEPFIDLAHSLIAAHLGVTTLFERRVQESHVLPYRMDAEDVLLLDDGPLASINTMAVNDAAVDFDSAGYSALVTLDTWGLRYSPGLRINDVVQLDYMAGWRPNNTPPQVKAAIVFTAQSLQTRPLQNAVMEEIGDYRIEYNTAEVEAALDIRTRSLLRGLKRPMI